MFLRSVLLGAAASTVLAAASNASPIVVIIEAEVTSVLDAESELPLAEGVFEQDIFLPGTQVVYAGVFDSTVPAPADGNSVIADAGNQGFAMLAAPSNDTDMVFAASGLGAASLLAQNAVSGQTDIFDEVVVAKFNVDTFEGESVTDTIFTETGPVGGQPLIGFGFGFDAFSNDPLPSLVQEGDTLNDIFQRIADSDGPLPFGGFEIEFGTPTNNPSGDEFSPYINISADISSFEVLDGFEIPDLEDVLDDMGGGGGLVTVDDILADFADAGILPAVEIPGIFELPDDIDEDFGFLFNGVEVTDVDPILFDPEIAIGYDYEITGGTPGIFFDSVLIPTLMGDDMFTISPFVNDMFLDPIALMADSEFDLTQFGDISLFRIEGIDPALELDPTDEFAFPTQLSFTQSGIIDLLQTPLTVDTDDMGGGSVDVAEPHILGVFGLGLAGVFALRRRRHLRRC